MDKTGITVELVERLIADQFPQWSDRLVRHIEHDGWDNTSFRRRGVRRAPAER
jgi:aminoglycoside phosphotransferase (APT) family kinase protein